MVQVRPRDVWISILLEDSGLLLTFNGHAYANISDNGYIHYDPKFALVFNKEVEA